MSSLVGASPASEAGITQLPIKADAGFSNELWNMIFEELHLISPESSLRLSCLSRKMNQLLTPFIYREVYIHREYAELKMKLLLDRAHENLRNYTQTFTVDSRLERRHLVTAGRLLAKCHNLKLFKWQIEEWSIWLERSPIPLYLLGSLAQKDTSLRLHFDAACEQVFDLMSIARSVPANNLESFVCVLTIDPPKDENSLNILGNFLVKCIHLRTLSLETIGEDENESDPGVWYFKDIKGRLPPVKELRLESYDWPSSPDHFNDVWDFSRLENLQLLNVDLGIVFSSIPSCCFCHLRQLEILDSRWKIETTVAEIENSCINVLQEPWPHLVRLEKLIVRNAWGERCPISFIESFEGPLQELDSLNLSKANIDACLQPGSPGLATGNLSASQIYRSRLTRILASANKKDDQDELVRLLSRFRTIPIGDGIPLHAITWPKKQHSVPRRSIERTKFESMMRLLKARISQELEYDLE